MIKLGLLLFLLMNTNGSGAEKPVAQPEVDGEFLSMLAKWRAAGTPGKSHELLKTLVGEWDVELSFHAGEQSWTSKCESQCTLLHGGRFILEQITGEMYAPDEKGRMRTEPFSATRLFGYDNFKQAFVGVFAENQNTHILTFLGHEAPGKTPRQIRMFGQFDEPMMGSQDTTMKYVLSLKEKEGFVWEVFGLAVGDDAKILEFDYTRRKPKD